MSHDGMRCLPTTQKNNRPCPNHQVNTSVYERKGEHMCWDNFLWNACIIRPRRPGTQQPPRKLHAGYPSHSRTLKRPLKHFQKCIQFCKMPQRLPKTACNHFVGSLLDTYATAKVSLKVRKSTPESVHILMLLCTLF